MKGLLVLFLTVCLSFVSSYKNYDGFTVYEVVPVTEVQLKQLKKIERDSTLDFWEPPSRVGNAVHVMVSPDEDVFLNRFLRKRNLEATVLVEDVGRLIAKHENLNKKKAFDYDDFNDPETTWTELERLASVCPTGFNCQIDDIGSTFQDRPLLVLRITKEGEQRRGLWFDSQIHAREWLSGATLMSITRRLIEDYDSDDEAREWMDTYDLHIMPVANPDGVQYTWTNDRLWRKNRSQNEGSTCVGTDLNRNFDILWGGVGSSGNPCSITYRGGSPGSELEVEALSSEMRRLGSSLDAWVNMHTYGNYWLIPWSDSVSGNCNYAADHERMNAVATAAATAAQNTYNDYTWRPGNWCEVLYESTGTAQDYAKAEGGIEFTFTPELRGPNFVVPPSEISKSREEIWNGFVAMIRAINE